MNPSRLLPYIGEPGTGRDLVLRLTEHSEGEPFRGWLENEDGVAVGRLERFRFRFVDFEQPTSDERAQARAGPRQAADVRGFEFIRPDDQRFAYKGLWYPVAEYLVGTDAKGPPSSVSFVTEAETVELRLHKHPWSGQCEVRVNGRLFGEFDLYNQSTAIHQAVMINAGEERPTRIEVVALGVRSPESMAAQVILEGVLEYGEILAPPRYKKFPPRNRGSSFSDRFHVIANLLPEDALILDVGGGKRQLNDPRYLNLEYSPYEEPDIFGDALALPFINSSIDFVYSAAVMEHVRDPILMGSEISRVLKIGATALINAAFMQPVHSEGQHFFNVTPYGIEEAMNELSKEAVWWQGNLSHTLKWFLDVTKITAHASSEEVNQFLEIARRFDRLLTPDRLMYIASGVWFEGVKPR